MAFKLRSGNGPLKFKNMGSSPVRHDDPVSHSHPENIKEHYGTYAEHVADMGAAGVDPYSVEEWRALNTENIFQAEIGGIENYKENREAYRQILDWERGALSEEKAIQKEKGTYEEFEMTPGLADYAVRKGIFTREEADERLKIQKEKDEAKKTEGE